MCKLREISFICLPASSFMAPGYFASKIYFKSDNFIGVAFSGICPLGKIGYKTFSLIQFTKSLSVFSSFIKSLNSLTEISNSDGVSDT